MTHPRMTTEFKIVRCDRFCDGDDVLRVNNLMVKIESHPGKPDIYHFTGTQPLDEMLEDVL